MKQHDHSLPEETEVALAGAAEVGQAYNALPSIDVPPELDAKVLTHAREAAGKTDNVVRLKRAALRRWAIPLTTAASVIVVMSVAYEMRFNTPRDSVGTGKILQQQDFPPPAAENLAPPSPESLASNSAVAKPIKPARQFTDTAEAEALKPPPVVVGPIAAPVITPVIPSVVVAAPPVTAAIAATSPSSEPALDGRVAMRDELDKKQAEDKATPAGLPEDKVASRNQAERAKPAAPNAAAQMSALSSSGTDATVNADAKAALASLSLLAGKYQYESYKIIKLSGEVQTLKDLGYSEATLDIDAQGTLTRSMTMSDGKVVTQTAKVVEITVDGHSGHWTVLWSDINYPVESTIMFDARRLTSRTQFEYLSDASRFGNVELAILHRVPSH